MIKSIFTASLLLSFTLGARADFSVDFESGAGWTGANDIRIPADTGTLFSLADDLKSDPTAFFRTRATYQLGLHHDITFLFAPLRTEADQNANGQNIALIESRGTGNFTLTLPSMKAKKEQLIYVPVILEKFEDVRVFQFSVKWDHTKLEYLKSESFNAELAGINETNIRYNEDQAGVLNSLWLNTDNKSLASHSTLFNMVFNVKASEGDNIDLRLNEVKAMEVAGQIQATYTDGKITISDISTKIKNAAYTDMAIKLFPNPASDFIHISAPNTFDILEITNINGAKQSLNYKSKTNYKLDMSSFPAGVYLLKTVSDGVVHTHKLVLSK